MHVPSFSNTFTKIVVNVQQNIINQITSRHFLKFKKIVPINFKSSFCILVGNFQKLVLQTAITIVLPFKLYKPYGYLNQFIAISKSQEEKMLGELYDFPRNHRSEG